MISTPKEYLDSLGKDGKEWLSEFFEYMEKNHSEYPITMFRQCPMYKKESSYLKGYLMFTANKNHFSVHTLYFDIIEEMKKILPNADFGKGCVKIKYKDISAKVKLKKCVILLLKDLINNIYKTKKPARRPWRALRSSFYFA